MRKGSTDIICENERLERERARMGEAQRALGVKGKTNETVRHATELQSAVVA